MPDEAVSDPSEIRQLEVPGAAPETPAMTVETAFFCYMESNGHWVAEGNMAMKLNIGRSANLNDMFVAAATIQKDVQGAEMAQRIVQAQTQAAQQMAQQIQDQAAHRQVAEGLDLSKLRTR